MSKSKKIKHESGDDMPAKPSTDATNVIDYLQQHGVSFKLVPQVVSDENVYLRSVLLKDDKGYLLAIYDSRYILDIPSLRGQLVRDMRVVEPSTFRDGQMHDENLNTYPAIPDYLSVDGVYDRTVKAMMSKNEIMFAAGQKGTMVVVSGKQLADLFPVGKYYDFTQERPETISYNLRVTKEDVGKVSDSFTAKRIKARVAETFELPLMPKIADDLLKLRVDPTAEATELARLVEHDPSLAAQMISWACSPYYGYPGKITSIDDAIIKVLGYDLVMNIALGIAIGQVMIVPDTGPLGLKRYWKHSIFAATLMECIISRMPAEYRAYKGLAYLCGLIHNIGFLLLGQVFPPHFESLSQSILANPHVAIIEIEQQLFTLNHQQIGAWLMESWHMPEEIKTVVGNHHNPHYKGEHSILVDLTYLANALLARLDLGDTINQEFPDHIIDNLKLTRETVEEAFDNFLEHSAELTEFINILAK